VSNTFSIMFTLGVLASLIWLGLPIPTQAGMKRRANRQIHPTIRIDAGISALVGGLIGARTGFVVLHWSFYLQQPIEIFRFWEGGLSWVTGAIGALLGLGLFFVVTRHSFWELIDSLALPGVIVALACWTGCVFDGCAYGRAMEAGLWTPPSLDMFGEQIPRWPTQTAGVMYSLAVIGGVVWLMGQDLIPGVLGSLSLGLIAVGAFTLSFTRADPVLVMIGVRLDTVGSGAMMTLAVIGIMLRIAQHRR
jgi:phosphatidylglycerol:prolipoprotein diacylglycerol transferase